MNSLAVAENSERVFAESSAIAWAPAGVVDHASSQDWRNTSSPLVASRGPRGSMELKNPWDRLDALDVTEDATPLVPFVPSGIDGTQSLPQTPEVPTLQGHVQMPQEEPRKVSRQLVEQGLVLMQDLTTNLAKAGVSHPDVVLVVTFIVVAEFLIFVLLLTWRVDEARHGAQGWPGSLYRDPGHKGSPEAKFTNHKLTTSPH